MNKNNQSLVPFCYVGAFILFFVVLWVICHQKFEDYSASSTALSSSQKESKALSDKKDKIESERALADMKMKNLKTIVETNVDPSVGNLGMFGNLFETIITKVRNNGLYIRSIEYYLNPEADPIYMENAGYNVCELKLALVSEYQKLRTFLIDLNNIENLVYVSKLDVSAFAANTDYLLIDISINLYSKRASGGVARKSGGDTPFAKKN